MWAQIFTLAIALLLIVPLGTPSAVGQSPLDGLRGPYQPLNQTMSPGVAGYWSASIGRAQPGVFQLLRVTLPTAGQVTFYEGPDATAVPLAAPAQMGVAVGFTYRLKLSEMPEYPGVELYPSLEILDRLTPPAGLEGKFPVPVEFTREEIELAIRGRLVTKVVYLEQPQMAYFNGQLSRNGVLDLPPHRNLLAEADQAGRPMVLVRLGGRLPDLHTDGATFFATGAPLAPQSESR